MAPRAAMLTGVSLTLVLLIIIFGIELPVLLCRYARNLAELNVSPDVNEEGQAPEAEEEQASDGHELPVLDGHELQVLDVQELQVLDVQELPVLDVQELPVLDVQELPVLDVQELPVLDVQELQVLDGEGGQVPDDEEGERRRRPDISRRSRAIVILRFVQYVAAPVLAAIVAGMFAAAGFGTAYGEGVSVVLPLSSALNMTCRSQLVATVDADIAGLGILVVIVLQIGLLALLAVWGHFHEESFGGKEVGAGLNLTHFALAIALAVQIANGKLSSADAIVGAMVLDMQSSAMSIQLVAKDVLAARWQVRATIASQIFGSAVLVACVVKFVAGDFLGHDENSCYCIKAFWWGWLTDCPGTAEAGEATIVWVYLASRMVASGLAAFFAVTKASKFHFAEKRRRDYLLQDVIFWAPIRSQANEAEDDSQTPSAPRPDGRAWLRMRDYRFSYTTCPATVTLQYTIYAAFSAISLIATLQVLARGMEASSSHVSVGQVIAMVVGVNTMLRVFWIIFRTCWRYFKQFRPAQLSLARASTF